MRIVLIADTFPPLCTSGAVQLWDLTNEFASQGHPLTVLLPSPDQLESWRLEAHDGVEILRLKAPRTKDIGYVRRTLGELIMPFAMLRQFRKSPLAKEIWDGVVWYSPSIFLGPLANAIKEASGCKGYLIIRDIFPEWALDMGLMRRGLPYSLFHAVAQYQYSVADVIGVQTQGNRGYFDQWQKQTGKRLEVLENWLADRADIGCSISLSQSALAGRKIFVYAGNMGIAQGMDVLLALAERLLARRDVGFVFVGRGSDAKRLATKSKLLALDNVLFFDEINPDEIPGLYSQCAVGLLALDSRHRSHNVPGKFITYMQSGLPVLAYINSGNDLADLIRGKDVGCVSEGGSVEVLESLALELIDRLQTNQGLQERCRNLYLERFTPHSAVQNIVSALDHSDIAIQ